MKRVEPINLTDSNRYDEMKRVFYCYREYVDAGVGGVKVYVKNID